MALSPWLESAWALLGSSPLSQLLQLLVLPLTLALLLGLSRWWLRHQSEPPRQSLYRPRVSCLITCYSEGLDVQRTLHSLWQQNYSGELELIPVVDGAAAAQADRPVAASSGEMVLALDSDTSFEHDMVALMVSHFEDPRMPAVAGNRWVRTIWH